MGRVCTVCALPQEQREEINMALVGGEAVASIAARYCTIDGRPLGRMSVQRHRDEHIAKTVRQAQEATQIAHGLDVVEQLRAINSVTMKILSEARQQRNPEVALKAIDRIQRQIELQAKLLGDLDERPVINLLLAPEWLETRATIIRSLDGHPEARRAVVGALSASVEAPR